jgi:hypothetical protein
MARPFLLRRHAVARRAKVVSGASREFPLPEPELITQVRPTSRFPLKFVINAG